jgi:hypothetical protein
LKSDKSFHIGHDVAPAPTDAIRVSTDNVDDDDDDVF